jgi:large subunit ribosomal protein L23
MRNGYGPQFAKFRVPLFFSKLDLRDYLWHAYKVEIVAVRSYIKQQRVRAENVGGRPAPRRWHRPRAHKHMTVQLVRPFVWPEEPESYKEWDMENMKASVEEGKEQQKIMGSDKDTIVNEERREKMREQAKLLLEGKARWKPGKLGTPATLVARNR